MKQTSIPLPLRGVSPHSGIKDLPLRETKTASFVLLNLRGTAHSAKGILVFFLSAFLFVFCASPIHAEGFDLSISPPLTQVTIKPGKGITQAFNIKNDSDVLQTLVVKLVPFSPNSNGIPQLDMTSRPDWLNMFSLANSKITLGQPFMLLPGQGDQLVLSFKVPSGTPLQDFYLSILLSSVPASDSGGLNQPRLSGSVAANLLIAISDQDPPATKLTISDFQVTTKPLFKLGKYFVFDNFTPLAFTGTVTNSGIHLAEIDGFFKLYQGKAALSTQPLLPSFVLAHSQRQLVASQSATLVYTPRFFDLGEAKATIELNNSVKQTTPNIYLLFIPGKLLIAIVVALAMLIFINRKVKLVY